jgi:spoIIIJ-associated protein
MLTAGSIRDGSRRSLAMSQQEDMVAQDTGHDESGSYVAVSHAADVADDAGDTADEALDDLDAEDEPETDEPETDEDEPDAGEANGQPERSSAADLELEGEVAADYIEGLLDVADLDGDIDMDVEGDRAVVSARRSTSLSAGAGKCWKRFRS